MTERDWNDCGEGPIKVLVLLNIADAQSVPLELAARIHQFPEFEQRIVAFIKGSEGFPFAEYGIDVVQLGATKKLAAKQLGQLWAQIEEVRPDIVHVHLWPSGVWGVLIGKLFGCVIVKTEHSDVRRQSWAKRIVNAFMYPFLELLICNSESTMTSLGAIESIAIGPRKMVIYNGVDFSFGDRVLASSSKLKPAYSSITLGTVARFVPEKNLINLLRAFASAVTSVEKELRLVMIGNGPLFSQIKEEIRYLGIEDKVVLTGGVERSEVYNMLSKLDAFIVSSLWEGFCNAMVEAAGVGLPILASRISTLEEVIGNNAIFFDPEDISSIASSIAHLAAIDEEQRYALGDSARNWVRSKYDINLAAHNYLEAFRQLKAG